MPLNAEERRGCGFGVGQLIPYRLAFCVKPLQNGSYDLLNERPENSLIERNVHRDANKKRSLSGRLRVVGSPVSLSLRAATSSASEKILAIFFRVAIFLCCTRPST